MQTVITGATGLVGANLAELLLAQGHRVRATRRSSSRVDHLAHLGIEWVAGDLSDCSALERAFTGADVVFHCAAQIAMERTASSLQLASNVAGTRNVLQAARSAGIGRLVYCSSAVAVGISDSHPPVPVDETAPWNLPQHGLDDGYARTKREAQCLVSDAAATGTLDAVIVNPGFMFGPYDTKPSSGRLIIDVAKRRIPGSTPGYNSFVDVRDVCRGMIAAWHHGRCGEQYILAGENLSYRELFVRIARLADVSPPGWVVPWPVAWMMGLAGDVGERLRGRELHVNSTTVRWAFCEGFQMSSAKAQAELDYTLTPLETALRDAITWFRGHGML